MNNIGLVLEGGGQRGIYTAGVLDALLDLGLRIGYVIGVSAGAACATAYLSGQKGRNYNVFIGSAGKKKYLSLRNYFTQGSVFGLRYVFDELPNGPLPLDYTAADHSGIRFTVVMTDCKTGRPVYQKIDSLRDGMEYLMASSAIPLVSRMFRHGGEIYLDGGASDSIPIEKSIRDGNDRNIIVLTKNAGYRLKETSAMSRAFIRLLYHKYPKLKESLLKRHETYNQSLLLVEKLESEGKALVLRPSRPISVSRYGKSRESLIDLYNNGLEDAYAMADEILFFTGGAENVRIIKQKEQ